MSQEKAQLIAPIDSSFSVPGLTVSGVLTATTFDGTITGVADSITQGKNLNVGVITALSFSGNLTGDAGGLIGSPNTVAGVVTANSFVGGITGNITGDVIGNASGIGASIKQGNNLNVGIATAVEWYGDGSGLTGAGSSAYVAQEITATGDETIIDLSYGNLIYYKGAVDTTVGFASTSAAEQLTFIRDASSTFDVAYNESFSTYGVTFDGTGDYLSMANNAAFQLQTGDWTMECFWKSGSGNTGNYQQLFGTQAVFAADNGIWRVGTRTNSNQIYFSRADGSGFEEPVWDINVNDEAWHHLAFTRASGYVYCWVDGVEQTNVGESNNITATMTTSNAFWVGYNGRDGTYNTGTVSSLRIVKGTAVYTTGTNFLPPSAALTNVTNTVLLCCQSSLGADTPTVSAGTIFENGDPTNGAQTVAYSGTNTLPNSTSITWPDRVKWKNNTTPTLFTNTYAKARQIFHFTTVDTGLNYNAWEEISYNVPQPYELFAWGDGREGALGQNDVVTRSSPVQITGTDWNSVSGSNDSGFAIKTDGTLWAWGSNTYGMLAQNNANPTGRASSPVQIGTDTTWDKLAETDSIQNKFGAIKTDVTLWSWGYGKNGALGLNQGGNQRSVSSPTQVGADTTWKSVRMLTSDGMEAVKTDGTFWSWGYNGNSGRLGQNGPDNAKYSSPTQVGTDTTWSLPAGGYNSGGGFKTDGTLWLWGWNGAGQLGLNNLTARSSPTQIPGTTWKSGYGQMGSYALSAFMKTDGTLWVWGGDGGGSLGINVGGPAAERRSSPTQIPGTTWNSISATYSNMGATKTDGTAWVWGKDDMGNLGLNSQGAQISSPTQLPGTWSDIQVSRNENFGLQAYNG